MNAEVELGEALFDAVLDTAQHRRNTESDSFPKLNCAPLPRNSSGHSAPSLTSPEENSLTSTA